MKDIHPSVLESEPKPVLIKADLHRFYVSVAVREKSTVSAVINDELRRCMEGVA